MATSGAGSGAVEQETVAVTVRTTVMASKAIVRGLFTNFPDDVVAG